jgi:hypothetical protein
MKTYYPYRFKTEKEFIIEYGENWQDIISNYGPNWCPQMDVFFGKSFPFMEYELKDRKIDSEYPRDDRWYAEGEDWMIGWKMLIENEPPIPNYKPRKITREI